MSLRAESESAPVKSADRVLRILEHLAAQGEPRALTDLARDLGIPKSSLHALLRTMRDRGWVEAVGGDRFGLGVRSLLVGTSYVDADDVVSLAGEALDGLAADLEETVHLGRLDGPDIVYLAKRESPHPLRLFSAIGRRLPAYSTAMGKAVLATRLDEGLDEHLPARLEPLTPNTHRTRDSLVADLRVIAERGYARDSEENMLGLVCLAVALPTADPPQDAISCSVPQTRLSARREPEIVERLLDARDQIVERLRRPGIAR